MKNKILAAFLLLSVSFIFAGTRQWNFTVIQEGNITPSTSVTFKFSCGQTELENKTAFPGKTISFSCNNGDKPSLEYIMNGRTHTAPINILMSNQNFNIMSNGISPRK